MGNLVKCFSRVQQYDICLLVFTQTSTVSVERFDLKLCCISYSIPISKGFRAPPPPPHRSGPPGARCLVIWPSPGREPKGSRPLLGISPPPPPLHFRTSYFLYIIGVKNNGEKIGHFDTCTNYSRCSQCNTLISCRRCVPVRLSVIFIFCELRRIANKNFLNKSFSSFVEFELVLLKTN